MDLNLLGDLTTVFGKLDLESLTALTAQAQAELKERHIARVRRIFDALNLALGPAGVGSEERDTTHCMPFFGSPQQFLEGVTVKGECAESVSLSDALLILEPLLQVLEKNSGTYSVTWARERDANRRQIRVVFEVKGVNSIPGMSDNKPSTVANILNAFEYLDTLDKNVESPRITDSAQQVEGLQIETGGDPESE
jgi:hypothetical protein